MDPGDHDWAEGSFVVAKGFSIRHEGQGKLVAEAGRIVRILENTDIGAIKAWLPDMATPSDRRFIYGSQSTPLAIVHDRSEERRVGKDGASTCRYRWWQHHKKKTTTTHHELNTIHINSMNK